MTINDRLKQHRTETGLSQFKYGISLGIPKDYAQQYILRYETKTTIPDAVLQEFAKVYPNKLVWLLTGEDNKSLKVTENIKSITDKKDKEIEELYRDIADLARENRILKEKLCKYATESHYCVAKMQHKEEIDKEKCSGLDRQ